VRHPVRHERRLSGHVAKAFLPIAVPTAGMKRNLAVIGNSKQMQPIAKDEVYRIAFAVGGSVA
jgi:hypothetical protein